jgi:HK97 family phage major capsid protein
LGLRRVPMMNVTQPVETTTVSFSWTGEGKPKVMSAGGFSTLSLPFAKAAGYITLTEELERFMQPGNEVGIRDVLVRAGQLFVDTEFCDQTTASTATRPGGLANGSPSSAASGTTAAAAVTDIKTMINAFVLVNPNFEDAQFVMSPSVAVAVAIATASTTLLATGGSLYGIPVTTTAVIGGKILLFDRSQVVYGDNPAGVLIDTSRVALLQFDGAPSDPSVATDITYSLWQRNEVAIRAEIPIRWKLARTDAARVLTGVAYV